MSTQDDKPTITQPNAQNMIRALKTERAGYVAGGMTDRVKAVDEQIKHYQEIARNAAENPDAASENRGSDEANWAQKMLDALKSERDGMAGRNGKEKRVEAIDEQIKHWTGVLRKATSASKPGAATPGSAAGQTQR